MARLSLAFHGDPDKLDFEDRVKLRMAKALTVNGLPYASLLYVWMVNVPVDTVLHSPHTDRVRMIVVESGAQRAGQWISVRRNVARGFPPRLRRGAGRHRRRRPDDRLTATTARRAAPSTATSPSGALHEQQWLQVLLASRAASPCWPGGRRSFLAAVAVIVLWALSGPLFGFSDTWQLMVNTTTTIVTFLMVFIIQNTQNRDTAAIQLKLDELIRATQGAHNALLDLEEIDDEQFERYRRSYEKLAAARAQEAGRRASSTPTRRRSSSSGGKHRRPQLAHRRGVALDLRRGHARVLRAVQAQRVLHAAELAVGVAAALGERVRDQAVAGGHLQQRDVAEVAGQIARTGCEKPSTRYCTLNSMSIMPPRSCLTSNRPDLFGCAACSFSRISTMDLGASSASIARSSQHVLADALESVADGLARRRSSARA